MALNPNIELRFVNRPDGSEPWEFEVQGGVTLYFYAPDPGPGEESELSCYITDAELAGVSTNGQFNTLVMGKLRRRYRNSLAAQLQARAGTVFTLA